MNYGGSVSNLQFCLSSLSLDIEMSQDFCFPWIYCLFCCIRGFFLNVLWSFCRSGSALDLDQRTLHLKFFNSLCNLILYKNLSTYSDIEMLFQKDFAMVIINNLLFSLSSSEVYFTMVQMNWLPKSGFTSSNHCWFCVSCVYF